MTSASARPGDFNYDLFISHASEDKAAFVRPLVARLQDAHLDVWYDETELRAGDSLIESVEKGLARSRFGLVVLSPAFFEKNWPRRELNALAAREMATGESVLMPVWLNVEEADVRRYSPLLADRFAVIASRGLDYTVAHITSVIRPAGSPVVMARELLHEHGVSTPPPSDPWWLYAIESAAEGDLEGTFQDAMEWFRWSFPLPPASKEPPRRAARLAQAVLRDAWVAEAERRPITQMTEPEVVHEFIHEMPGLADTCFEHPAFLAAYAPQVTIPGLGGAFEEVFDRWVEDVRSGDVRPSETVALHAPPDYFGESPASLACSFVQGHIMGPEVKVRGLDTIDYLFWLLSDRSAWLPDSVHALLLEGMSEWAVRPHYLREEERPFADQLYRAQERRTPPKRWSPSSRRELLELAAGAGERVGLPESGEELADRLLQSGAIEAFVQKRLPRDD